MPVAAPAPPRDYRAEFPIFGHAIHLSSCSPGALSVRSRAPVNGLLAGTVADGGPGCVPPYFHSVPDDHRAAIERLTRDQ